METLSTRAQRLTTQTSTKRLLSLCSLLGLVSLIGVCVSILPWNVLLTQGEWVAFSLIAVTSFCWLGAVAAVGGLEMSMEKTVKRVVWMLTVTMLAQLGLGAFLEYKLVTLKSQQLEYCLSLNATYTSEFCEQRFKSILIAFPIVVSLLLLFSLPLLYLLFRQSPLLSSSSSSHLYSNLANPSMNDLPANWHVPPRTLAPDSSASDNDDYSDDDDKSGRRRAKNERGIDDGTRESWFEMGKRERGGAAETHGKRWGEVKRERQRKGKGRA
ncbi:uncharacterized protein JCM6883_001473 [Sporobolomyces salmoneus]|uniref:uncharacterized protein n=1 Tax=Sporobolomyces salmoneus TaxID=183962 RepID=UPI00316F23D5